MRFLSKFGRFGVQIRPMINEAYATGMTKIIQDPIYALFHEGGLEPHERELAFAQWGRSFNGFYQEQDEVTVVPPDYRIGLFDSERAQVERGWPDEIRLEVERVLCDLAERFNDIIAIKAPEYAPPWPRYDDYTGTPAALVRKLVDEGYELDHVLAYERENQNRERVVAALAELLSDPEKMEELRPQKEEVLG